MNRQIILKEITTDFTRSSGAGGQNVNKVNTKVTIKFNVTNSEGLSDDEKEKILAKLSKRITNEQELVLSSQLTRSQLKNRQQVIEKLFILLDNSLKVNKPRKSTKPTKSSIEKRIKTKKRNSEIKKTRQKPGL